ncbi:hypothetical protein BJ508DRAFT_235186 [Ascobolus immersus RN42]|uniref:Uncharacterized protein n=1 Tax=Ascobolus immersus RN42 TaxID=1160509 RepID=A0A3N4IKC1_ASCIM|nr:hypothetical protein BJ508DRAFT_235186 [Ascobolus immersus RN42]
MEPLSLKCQPTLNFRPQSMTVDPAGFSISCKQGSSCPKQAHTRFRHFHTGTSKATFYNQTTAQAQSKGTCLAGFVLPCLSPQSRYRASCRWRSLAVFGNNFATFDLEVFVNSRISYSVTCKAELCWLVDKSPLHDQWKVRDRGCTIHLQGGEHSRAQYNRCFEITTQIQATKEEKSTAGRLYKYHL